MFCLNPKSELAANLKVGFIPMALVEDGFSGNHLFEERIWNDVKKGYCHFANGNIGIRIKYQNGHSQKRGEIINIEPSVGITKV